MTRTSREKRSTASSAARPRRGSSTAPPALSSGSSGGALERSRRPSFRQPWRTPSIAPVRCARSPAARVKPARSRDAASGSQRHKEHHLYGLDRTVIRSPWARAYARAPDAGHVEAALGEESAVSALAAAEVEHPGAPEAAVH